MSGLFTVLIAEKEHINAIRQSNKLFFEPFLASKDLAFCDWNPEGQNLADSVPGLLDAVGRRQDWRAVIINNCTVKTSKLQNPYDIVDYSAVQALTMPAPQPAPDEPMDLWEAKWKDYYEVLSEKKEAVYNSALEYPLQKLATWLCFRPEDYIHNEVQEKQDVTDWAMEMIGRDDEKSSTKLELLERAQYKRELRMKESIRRSFLAENYLSIAYPSEVYCISPRAAENNYFDPDAYWNIRPDSEYSTFADRNMYFDRMRFLVFDMLSYTNRNFRSDYIRFLATILVFVSNPIPGSAMQARRLYQLETTTDDAPLCTLVTSYDRKLAATSDVIENEMEQIRSEIPGEMTDKAALAMFCTPTDIPILLDDSCDPESIFAEKDYGLFFDTPEDESHRWNRDYRASEKALSYISRQQHRAVRKSVGQMHISSEVSDANISRLTPLQIDDIREYTDDLENEMVASIPPDLRDVSPYTERLAKAADNVKKTISRRMTRQTAITLSGVCLGLFFLCFLPFLFANSSSIKTIMTAVILSAAMLGVLAVIMLVCLFVLRLSVVNAIKAYNNTAREILNDIQSSLKRFSRYLNALCSVRRGHSVQNYAKMHVDEYTRRLRIRKKHLEDIRKKRAFLAEKYQDFFGDRSVCDETMSRPYEYDFDQRTEFEYPAPFLSADCRQIEFINNGNYVTVPSSYITRIVVRMEGLYGK